MIPTAAAALLKASYVNVRLAPLTSINNPHPTLSVTVSLDAREDWVNQILENSRFATFFVNQNSDGTASVKILCHGFRGKSGFRNGKAKSTEAALAKIQAWLDVKAAEVKL